MLAQYTQIAAELVIADAIEKGHTSKNELVAYMQSEVYENAVVRYVKMMIEQFGN